MQPAAPLVWLNRQRTVAARQLSLGRTRLLVDRAWPDILASARRGSVLSKLEGITIVLVSDRRIAELHTRFMGDPAPTDVITFQHGEIVVSAETARREARLRGLPVPREIALYAVHGLLHLAGWSDQCRSDAAEMRAAQEKILRRAARSLC
ncbi:MAG: rRNA maturation RNase YbeY [Chthoniobacterales bacterium]|nr:rRNA maturation RNase YbeY [Chthoniobacterales bacterium]